MTSSIIATTKATYFTIIYVTLSYIRYFSVIKALYEFNLLVDINCCRLKNILREKSLAIIYNGVSHM